MEVVVIRCARDVDDFIDDPFYKEIESMDKEKHRESMKKDLKRMKQYAFIKETGDVIAAMINGELYAFYPEYKKEKDED